MKKNIIHIVITLIILIISIILDKQITLLIASNRLNFLNIFFKLISYLASTTGIIIILLISLLFVKDKNKFIKKSLLVILTALIITWILKLIIARPRPFTVLQIKNLIEVSKYSFPSGHATAAFAILPILIEEFKKIKYVLIMIALLILYSRIYLGIHYLTDVIMGALIGYSSYLFYRDKIKGKKRKVKS